MAKLLDQIRSTVRARHYSIRTERTYIYWIRQFIRYHSMRHPSEDDDFAINKMDSLLDAFNNVMGVVLMIGMGSLSLWAQSAGEPKPYDDENRDELVQLGNELEAAKTTIEKLEGSIDEVRYCFENVGIVIRLCLLIYISDSYQDSAIGARLNMVRIDN